MFLEKSRSFKKGKNMGPVKRALRNGPWQRQPGGPWVWELLSALIFFNNKTNYNNKLLGLLHFIVQYVSWKWGSSKQGGAALCLPLPHIHRASISNLYKGPLEATTASEGRHLGKKMLLANNFATWLKTHNYLWRAPCDRKNATPRNSEHWQMSWALV